MLIGGVSAGSRRQGVAPQRRGDHARRPRAAPPLPAAGDQVATGILSEGQIAAPLRDVLKRHRNAECELADAVDVHAATHQVVAERPGGERVTLPYDDLVVAAGQSYFGHDEFARWAPGMKTVADALAIRRRVFGAFELAETATDPE